MEIEQLLSWASGFYHSQPLLVLGIAAAAAVVTVLRPKQTAKTLGTLALLAVAAYVVYMIGEALLTGVEEKNRMIHK
jgi:hypothetical protein